MTRKEQLQQERNQLKARLDAVEKELINTPAEELARETDTDADDSDFAATLKREGKLEPHKPGSFIVSER